MTLWDAALPLLLVLSCFAASDEDVTVCPSTQYLKEGTTGLINCSFKEDFFTVLWYNSANTGHDKELIALQGSVKSGIGYESEEFDVCLNGSLIIKNVTRQHNRTFTVLIWKRELSAPDRYSIIAVPVEKSFTTFPVITQCTNADKVCVLDWKQHSEVSCLVANAPSVVPLTWHLKTIEGDRNISCAFSVVNQTFRFTSRVITKNPFLSPSWLALLACKAESPPGLLQKNESFVLLLNETNDRTGVKPVQKYAELGSRLALKCHKTLHLVWQVMKLSGDKFDNIFYAALSDDVFVNNSVGDYELDSTNSLVVSEVGIRHERLYRCISSDGMTDNVVLYDISLFVSPVPNHPVIEGCNHEYYCVIEVQKDGSITCTVKRIRPLVKLDLKTFYEDSSIQFYEKQVITKDNGDTSDISLTIKYRIKGSSQKRITLECRAAGEYVEQFDPSTKFDVLVLTGVNTTEASLHSTDQIQSTGKYYWIIVVPLAIAVISCAVVITEARNRKRARTRKCPEDGVSVTVGTDCRDDQVNGKKINDLSRGKPIEQETSEMQGIYPIPEDNLQDKKTRLVDELKSKYKDLCGMVQPIPYVKDRALSIDRVFIDNSIEYLDMNPANIHGTWKKLGTYQSIFKNSEKKSMRSILEGDPGYGKSAITLKIAYDWCYKVRCSALYKVDILILLRLRQLGGVKSVYEAIKRFLLPKDSRLSKDDIKKIIDHSKWVVVVLDGFDEYPDKDQNDSDVISIIKNVMLQKCQVITTTRSSCLPKEYPHQTERLKLTGFDDNAREQYIQKVVGYDVKIVEKIKRRLKDNPTIAGLCQVPLFFVLIVHVIHEIEDFQSICSVTSFFRHIVFSFHSHMKNKMKDDNVQEVKLFETEHRELSKIAFEELRGKNQNIVWRKEQLCERLGQDFYNQYVKTGILIEEEVLTITDQPSASIIEHVQYKTEVRFYHRIFCEWYAAHHFAKVVLKDHAIIDPLNDSTLDMEYTKSIPHCQANGEWDEHMFKNLNPPNLQYLHRFACGINPAASEQIIRYLKGIEERQRFISLCYLEQGDELENLVNVAKELCNNELMISSDDNLLSQVATIKLLTNASSNKIPISSVRLHFCSPSFDSKEGVLYLSSGLRLPRLDTLETLIIDDKPIKDLCDIAEGILDYSTGCRALTSLKFSGVLMPQSIDNKDVLDCLNSKGCKVSWNALSGHWCLNLENGRWKKEKGSEVTKVEYKKEKEKGSEVTNVEYKKERVWYLLKNRKWENLTKRY